MSPLSPDDVYAAFAVTRDEVDAFDNATGWPAAREQAALERTEHLAWAQRQTDYVAAELTRSLGMTVKWNDKPLL